LRSQVPEQALLLGARHHHRVGGALHRTEEGARFTTAQGRVQLQVFMQA